MAASKIKVNIDSLKTDAASIGTAINEIQKGLTNLKQAMAKLDAMWDGPSSEAMKATYQGDMESLKGMIEMLKAVNQYETKAVSKYNACETRIADVVASIKV